MANYVPDFGIDSVPPDSSSGQTYAERERLKILLIGSAEGIREMIHRLHQGKIAEAGSWSRLLPAPEPGEVMCILMLYRRRS